MKRWDIMLDGKPIGELCTLKGYRSKHVKDILVTYDGYDKRIKVRRCLRRGKRRANRLDTPVAFCV